jgi:hypothetical protein
VSLCLLPLLSSCATPVFDRDPQLLVDCGRPKLEELTNAGLLKLALEQQAALEKCTAEKRALRLKGPGLN